MGNRDVVGKPMRKALPKADSSQLAIMDRVYASGEPHDERELPPLVAQVPVAD